MARKTGSHSEITGPLVREAAERLFARHGYAAVSMRQIAGEVGVQAGALYNYTPDKQSLLYDMMSTHMQSLLQSWSDADPGGTPMDRLQAFTRHHIHFHLQRPDAVFIAYMELRNLEAQNFARIEVQRKAYEMVLENILQDGQGAGAFHVGDVKLAGMAVIAMLTGVTTWFRDDGRLSVEEIANHYWDMVRKAVGA
ncbi:TetR family transcriptional regulator [Actibacterium mucosum KCTC 23349]|uniref:TetR family transcriptional regulator n=1 Tax=Actibacterium mucosum KCTC 23349 TaxID=1454373 RepID=A0A037ZKG9_9RHOB|nr:TetR/AcrR family transcriptional regulator [Actibacterium mucosum]KAJ55316.1 TetR family transcriptional regulator [Actibacterium mucosum KCTC 23349]